MLISKDCWVSVLGLPQHSQEALAIRGQPVIGVSSGILHRACYTRQNAQMGPFMMLFASLVLIMNKSFL